MRVLDVEAVDEFETLYAQRERLYRALALTVGNPSLAAEGIDEALARAYERWGRIGRYDNPGAWVFRVALNWCRSAQRKRKREDLWSEPPDRPYRDHEPQPELRRAIGRLPVGMRSVVVARYLLDWSTAETARALGVTPGAVKSRLHRALALLARQLEGPRR